MNQIKENVNSIANDLSIGVILNSDDHQHIMDETGQEPGEMMYASDYLADVLDIEYVISSNGDYLGARVLVAFGGPTIRINTRTMTVEGGWWSDSHHSSFSDAMAIDEYLEEMYQYIRA